MQTFARHEFNIHTFFNHSSDNYPKGNLSRSGDSLFVYIATHSGLSWDPFKAALSPLKKEEESFQNFNGGIIFRIIAYKYSSKPSQDIFTESSQNSS